MNRPRLTDKEVTVLAHITRHLFDYTRGDDRPDHGLDCLRTYRDLDRKDELFQAFTSAMQKLNRMERRITARAGKKR